MFTQESFVRTVGQMPFSAKHRVRHFYAEGVRASQRGDLDGRTHYTRRLGQFAATNAIVGVTSFGMAALAMYYGVRHNVALQFAPETFGAALKGLGNSASALAQVMIRKRVTEVPIVPTPQPEDPPEEHQPSRPTMRENLVTNGGIALAAFPVVHVTINEIATGGLQIDI